MRNELNAIIIDKYKSDYKKSTRNQKSKILDDLSRILELDRKYLIKLLTGQRPHKKQKRAGRPRLYDKVVSSHIVVLHDLMNEICPKRMKAAMPLWMPFYEDHYGYLGEDLRAKLLRISSATIGRIIKEESESVRGKSSTKVNHKLKTMIPIKRLDEKVTEPGTVQADTVAHCGQALLGDFINTLTLTDIHTNWTDNRACWTKQSKEIKKRVEDIEKNTPIIFKNFDTDCGTEFLNYDLMSYFEKGLRRKRPVKMRRSRPYKKNDQCYVEQKNHTHVRKLFDYDRLEDPNLIMIMNKIYKEYWNPLHNYFLPSFKLEEKIRVGSKIKKKFDTPKTPAQRLLESKGYSGYMKKQVQYQLKRLDPIKLKKGLEKELDIFYMLLNNGKRRTA